MSEVMVYINEVDNTPNSDHQLAECLTWIDEKSVILEGIYIEGLAKQSPLRDRAKLLRLIMELKRGQVFLIYSRASLQLDELAMSFLELEVTERRCIIRSACEPDLVNLLSPTRHAELSHVVNEYRTQLLGGKIRTSLQERLAEGLRAGNIKLGHQADDEGRVYENKDELAAIELVKQLRARGVGVDEVQEELALRGITCRSGRVPSIPTISRWTYHDTGKNIPPKVKVKLEDKHPHLAEEVLRLRNEGLSYVKMCSELANLGYRSRTGKSLMPTQLRRIFMRLSAGNSDLSR